MPTACDCGPGILSLAAAAAQAQDHPTTYGSFAPNMTPPKHIGGGHSPRFKRRSPTAPMPGRTRTSSTIAPLKPIGSMEPLDGGRPSRRSKANRPIDGLGTYKPYKPPKVKSVYDH